MQWSVGGELVSRILGSRGVKEQLFIDRSAMKKKSRSVDSVVKEESQTKKNKCRIAVVVKESAGYKTGLECSNQVNKFLRSPPPRLSCQEVQYAGKEGEKKNEGHTPLCTGILTSIQPLTVFP